MKTKLRAVVLTLTAVAAIAPASRAELLDTSRPERTFVPGVRAGFNVSTLTNNYTSAIPNMTVSDNRWGNGVNVGAVVDIRFRNFFAVQTGLYLATRGNSYTGVYLDESRELAVKKGNLTTNYLQLPILASLRLGMYEKAQLHLDLGPYMAWGFGGEEKTKQWTATVNNALTMTEEKHDYYTGSNALCNRYDWGVKTGAGLQLKGKFYLGAHYQYGLRNVLRMAGHSGHNHMWTFTAGYDF